MEPPVPRSEWEPESPLLILEEGTEETRNWALSGAQTTIGRWTDNDIVLPDRRVSRTHARIERRGNEFVLIDLNSTNGTFVNGKRLVEEHFLQNGDMIQIAPRFQLRFVDRTATVPLTVVFGKPHLQIDPEQHSVTIGNEPVSLSASQFQLLAFLAASPGRVLSREEIVEAVWPSEEASGVTSQALDALVRRLRERLAEVDPDHTYVVTVRGHGFKFQNR